jgi:hypothetical protein
MKFGVSLVLLVMCLAGSAMAVPVVPEINPSSGATALTLLAFALMVIRGRRK